MEHRISATELARNLGDILGRVRYRGERYLVERHGTVIARIEPVTATAAADGPLDLAAALAARLEALRPAGLVAAYLFGSQARGTARTESDVDVALLLDPRVHPTRTDRDRVAAALTTELVAAVHRDAMDVVVLNDAHTELAVKVVTEGRRLLVTDAEAEHAFTRDTQLRYADLRPFLDRTRRIRNSQPAPDGRDSG